MADLAQTISNTLTVIGPASPSTWGNMVWGVDSWGSSNDQGYTIGKWLAESISSDTALYFDATHKIEETFSVTSNINLVALQDGSGYTYVENGATDPDDRLFPTYTEETGSEPTYTGVTASDPGWSDA